MKFLAIFAILLLALSAFVKADCDDDDYAECIAQQAGQTCVFFQNSAYCDRKFDCQNNLSACLAFQSANPDCSLDCNSALSMAPTMLLVGVAAIVTVFATRR